MSVKLGALVSALPKILSKANVAVLAATAPSSISENVDKLKQKNKGSNFSELLKTVPKKEPPLSKVAEMLGVNPPPNKGAKVELNKKFVGRMGGIANRMAHHSDIKKKKSIIEDEKVDSSGGNKI